MQHPLNNENATELKNAIEKTKVVTLDAGQNSLSFIVDLSLDMDKVHEVCKVIYSNLRLINPYISLDTISNLKLNYFKMFNENFEIPTDIDFWKSNCKHPDYNCVFEVFIRNLLNSFCVSITHEVIDDFS